MTTVSVLPATTETVSVKTENNNNQNSTNNKMIVDNNASNKPTSDLNNKVQKGVKRKASKLTPLSESRLANIMVTNAGSSAMLAEILVQQKLASQRKRTSDGGGRVKVPLPVAVARRNARERNRVKQVNNGFAALRQHIPEEIAEQFESTSALKGATKKLSKVETLRMAVEYIRNLETLLSQNESQTLSETYQQENSEDSFDEKNISMPATPPPEQAQPFFFAIKPRNFQDQDTLLNCTETQITIINGQQYIRIPGTNTFQLITPDVFNDNENEENIQPSPMYSHLVEHASQNQQQHLHHQILSNQMYLNQTSESSNENLIIDTLTTTSSDYITNNIIHQQQQQQQLQPLRIVTPASISPSAYSGHSSLSPAQSIISSSNACANACATTSTRDGGGSSSGNTLIDHIKQEHHDLYYDTVINIAKKTNNYRQPTILLTTSSSPYLHHQHLLKTEIHDNIEDNNSHDIMLDDAAFTSESMNEVMSWWQHEEVNELDDVLQPKCKIMKIEHNDLH
jgi:hypothetical protein